MKNRKFYFILNYFMWILSALALSAFFLIFIGAWCDKFTVISLNIIWPIEFYVFLLLLQWGCIVRILRLSSIDFLKKNKKFFLIYNYLFLNFWAIHIYKKIINNNQSYNVYNNYDQSLYQQHLEIVYKYRLIFVLINCIIIPTLPIYLWSLLYMKYALKEKTDYYISEKFNRFLYWF